MKLYFVVLTCLPVFLLAEPELPLPKIAGESAPPAPAPQTPAADPITVTFVNDNKHHIEVHNERTNRCDCTPFFGKQFKECMAYVSRECFQKNLAELSDRARIKYARDLSLAEMREVKSSFNAEHWQELRATHADFADIVDARLAQWAQWEEERKKNAEVGFKEIAGMMILLLIMG